VDEHPKGLWKSAASLAPASWNTYNFINARMRASDTIRVQAVSKREGRVVVIETQMYRRVRSRVGGKNIDRYEERKHKTVRPDSICPHYPSLCPGRALEVVTSGDGE